jgi:hypothetical protein
MTQSLQMEGLSVDMCGKVSLKRQKKQQAQGRYAQQTM